MMKTLARRLLHFALGVAVLSSGAFAAVPTGILSPDDTYKPTGTISDSHLETLFVQRNGVGPGMEFLETKITKKLRVTVKADLTGVDTTQFDSDTPIFLSVGSFTFNESIFSDFRYKPGKKSVRILFSEDTGTTRGVISTGSISFAWTPKVLTATLTYSPYALVGDVVSDLLGGAPSPNKPFATTGKTTVTVGIAGRTGTRTLFYKAILLNTEKSLRVSGVSQGGQCNSASLTGGFDIKPPVLKSKFPTTAGTAPFNLRLEFTEADILRDARLGVDGVTGTYTSIAVENDPMAHTHFVQINGLRLMAGVRKLALNVRDESGNIVIVKKTVVVSP